MKLPNDLIKSTDYDKAKDRIIHEFECVNGKVVQHYVLGGEHELTTQEIIDCLNALATIDCDLQTAYAYIKGQQDKIADLEAKIAELREQITILDEENSKTFMKSVNAWRENAELKQQLTEKDKEYQSFKKIADENVNYLKNRVLEETRSYNQDKISFAVEKLQEAKRLLEEKYTYDVEESDFAVIYEDDVDEIIDNQIKQLKEQQK